MTPQEYAYQIQSAAAEFKAGQLSNTEFAERVAWLTLVGQGVERPTAEQLHARAAEVIEAARFASENPTLAEVDAASSFISPAP